MLELKKTSKIISNGKIACELAIYIATFVYGLLSVENYSLYMPTAEYSPNMNEPCKEITPVNLEITVSKPSTWH